MGGGCTLQPTDPPGTNPKDGKYFHHTSIKVKLKFKKKENG